MNVKGGKEGKKDFEESKKIPFMQRRCVLLIKVHYLS